MKKNNHLENRKPVLSNLEKEYLTDQSLHIARHGGLVEFASSYKSGGPFSSAIYCLNPSPDELIEIASRRGDIAILTGLDAQKVSAAYIRAIEKIKQKETTNNTPLNKRLSLKMPAEFKLKTLSPRLGSSQVQANRLDIYFDIDLNGFVGKNYEKLTRQEKRKVFIMHAQEIYKSLKIKPWYILIGRGGIHIAYKLNNPLIIDPNTYSLTYGQMCLQIEAELNFQFKIDRACKDIARLRRLPGTSNYKDPNDPVKTEITHFSKSGFGDELYEYASSNIDTKKISRSNSKKSKKTSEDQKRIISNYCDTFSANEGERNSNCFKMLLDLVALQLPREAILEELERFVERGNDGSSTPFTIEEGLRVLESIETKHQNDPYTLSLRAKKYLKTDDEPKRTTPAEVAFEFLRSKSEDIESNQNSGIVYWCSQLYFYKNKKWSVCDKKYLGSLIVQHLIREDLTELIQRGFIQDVMIALQGICPVSPDLMAPFNIPTKTPLDVLICKEEIINLRRIIYDEEGDKVSPLTPDTFYLNKLQFKYDPEARSDKWQRFLVEILPEGSEREVLQEFIGSILFPSFIHEKFLIIVGKGANGKSVLAYVIQLLVGQENISSVSLENLDPKRLFTLAPMENKLLNLVSDMGVIKGAAEGMLKTLVSGEKTLVERKHEDARSVIFKAKHIFISNSIPIFNDTSDGLARRAIIINFKVQFLDPNKANPNLKTEDYWIDELPGILNWAIEGVIRLQRRGHLIVPESSQAEFEELRREVDFTGSYISDHLEPDQANLPQSPSYLYGPYVRWCESSGHRALSQGMFIRSIKRIFPTITQAKSPTSSPGGRRERLIFGVRQKASGT